MKRIKILSTVSAICLTISTSISASASSYIRGDANCDGKVNIRDAACIAQSMINDKSLGVAADFNLDGKVNIRDAAAISTSLTQSKIKSYISVEEEVLALVNKERAKVGAAPLTLNPSLNTLAAVRAKEASINFSHTRPNGKSCFSVLPENNLTYSMCGENLAAGNSTAKETVEQWVNSPGHYANMINSNFTELGLALYYDKNTSYGYYWVQIFRRP